VVTAKTINPGIGISETWTYGYTGNPQYFVDGGNIWGAEYRGFGQVRETDAAGNYSDHWFYTTASPVGDIDKLTGREYKTEWHKADNSLLSQKIYDWEVIYTENEEDHTYNYTYIDQLTGGVYTDAAFNQPRSVAVSNDGYVYVADTVNSCIWKFTSSGALVNRWGRYGSGDGQLEYPQGVAVSSNGYVYVADTNNNRIQKFTSDGTFVTKWGSQGSPLGPVIQSLRHNCE
jgi:DNA-binding beta-propeller fold protein YncE